MNINEYCKLLGVKPGDSAEAVKIAFREKIKECHPDLGGDIEKAKRLIEAYEALKNGVPVSNNVYTSSRNKEYTTDQTKIIFEEYLRRVFAMDPFILNIIKKVLEKYTNEKISEHHTIFKDYKKATETLEEFEKAELSFHSAMQKFNRDKKRPIKYRSLDLIKNLSQVQILYRSIMVRHPSYALKCKNRLRQIHELMEHAKITL